MWNCKIGSRILTIIAVVALYQATAMSQENPSAPPLIIDVNSINWTLSKTRGDGGMVNEYSWNFATFGPDFDFYWPADQYLSNMLYQIFSPIMLSDSGIVDTLGVRHPKFAEPSQPISQPATDWTWERRRYRPPNVTVDGVQLNPPYQWQVDPKLPADEVAEFDDLIPAYGMRAHVTVYAFSNPDLSNVAIWKVTLKFTGEVALPKTHVTTRLPDQTISMWWPFSISFGPTMGGYEEVYGGYPVESENVLDDWYQIPNKYVTDDARKDLLAAYYWCYYNSTLVGTPTFPNGSQDASGNPDRTTGHLYSPQVPGYALLYAPVSVQNNSDDPNQPYSMMHASIANNLWQTGQDFRNVYVGTESNDKFPPDPITMGIGIQKGPMRFVTAGPYSMTKNSAAGRYDSVTFVYAIGAGTVPYEVADSVGKAWFSGKITDAAKDSIILAGGKDSLANSLDRAYWAWDQISHGRPVPAAPAPPDVNVTSGPDRITVNWSYPDPSYFNNAVTGVDDWYAWRVYRKTGAYYVDDPLDNKSGAQWQLVYQTTDRNVTTYIDTNVVRGVNYYYAVTAVDNGSQNNGIDPGTKMESSRYATRTTVAASSYKPGLSVSGQVRVVPNPATVAAGALAYAGTPDKLLFVNLPVSCTLSIYTETGDKVRTWQHYGTADDTWDQRTSGNQYVASGIYILAVTNSKGLNGQSLPDQFVKFVLVR